MNRTDRQGRYRNLGHELRAERRARNTFALLALVGWVLALALLGHQI